MFSSKNLHSKPKTKKNGANEKELTIVEWFDKILPDPAVKDKQVKIEALPDFYTEEHVTFENQNAHIDTLNQRFPLKTNMGTSKEKKGEANKLQWHYRKSPNHKYSSVTDDHCIDIELQPKEEFQIVVVSGLFFGSSGSNADVISAQLKQIDPSTIHSLVLLGNVFDAISLDRFNEKPSTSPEIEQRLRTSGGEALLEIKKIAENTTVYYLQGTHEISLTKVAIERLLGDKVIHVPKDNLIASVKDGNTSYRVRLTSGKELDLFMNWDLPDTQLLVGRTFGEFLYRAAANNSTFNTAQIMEPLASTMPDQYKKDILDKVSQRPLQDKINQTLLSSALEVDPVSLQDVKCVISEGKYVSARTIVDYPHLKLLLEKYGHEKLSIMLQASAGNYIAAVKQFHEDVVVIGYGHKPLLDKLNSTETDAVIYACPGGLSSRYSKATISRIKYPKRGINGSVEIIELKDVKAVESTPVENGNHALNEKPETKDDVMSIESLE